MGVTLSQAFMYYIGDWFWCLLWAAAIVVIMFSLTITNRLTLACCMAFSVILLYNPIALKLICKFVEPYTYYRFFWIAPAGIMISRAMIDFMGRFKFAGFSVIMAVMFFVMLNNIAVPFYKLDTFKLPENEYQLEGDIFRLQETIASCGESNPRIAMPMPVQMEYRTYDASVQSAIRKETYQGMGRNDYVFSGKSRRKGAEYVLGALLNNIRTYSPEEVRNALKLTGSEYVISPRVGEIYDTLSAAGCREIATTDSYIFYKVS